MNLRFQAKFLPLVAPFMAQQDIRYYLNGISVRPWGEGVLIAATDGHTLALAYDRTGVADREVILTISPGLLAASRRVPREWRALKDGMQVVSEPLTGFAQATATGWVDTSPSDKPQRFRLVLNAGNECRPGYTDVHVQPGGAEIDGKFPDVARVIPKREELKPGAPHAYQVQYLHRLPAGNTSRWRYSNCVRFYSAPFADGEDCTGAPDKATVLVCHLPQEPDFMALIMPLRDTWKAWKGQTLPQWWTEELDRRNAPPAAA